MKKIFIMLASLTLMSSVWAVNFDDVDVDGDNVLSVEEAAIVEDLDIIAADVNADGVISREEYEDYGAVTGADDSPFILFEPENPVEETPYQ